MPALGSLHLTPHHLIFLSEGENELWVRCPFKGGALDAGVGWCHASEGQAPRGAGGRRGLRVAGSKDSRVWV